NLESSRMAPKEKQTIEIEKTHGDPLLPFNQAVTVDCSDFLGRALVANEKGWSGRWGSQLRFPVFSRTCETFYGTERNNLAAWEPLIAALKLPRFSHPAFRIDNNISTTLPC